MECSIEAYGHEVASLLARLDLPPAILVGHSMGCRVVLQTYRTAPERVAGLVLLDGSCIADDGDGSSAEAGMSAQLERQGYLEFVRIFFEEMFLPSSDPQLKAAVIARALRLPPSIGAPLLSSIAGWDAAELRGALDSVRVPLLAIQATTLNSERARSTGGRADLSLAGLAAHSCARRAHRDPVRSGSLSPFRGGRPGERSDRRFRLQSPGISGVETV